jgi:HD-GYP domain-containing protein (c-di-GMP phosphodiesterase class II)
VVLGRVALGGGDGGEGAAGDGDGVEEGHIEALTRGLERLEGDELNGFRELDRAVWRLMEATARSGRSFLLAGQLRQAGERLYRHSVSVCLHALALARAAGIEGPTLHALAVGALLHDVGLLDLPPQLLEQRRALGPEERAALRRHPEIGAARLAGIGTVPELAVLVAYEHHTAWDGQGGYPRLPRRPGLAAQVTAVADVWDILYHKRRGRRLDRRRYALEGLARLSGQLLNPRLVDLFAELITARP